MSKHANQRDVFTQKSFNNVVCPIIIQIGKDTIFYDLYALHIWTHQRGNSYDPITKQNFSEKQMRNIDLLFIQTFIWKSKIDYILEDRMDALET
jgi:hypothetical protein